MPPLDVTPTLVQALPPQDIAATLNLLASLSDANHSVVATLLPDPVEYWERTLSNGPDDAGSGMRQHAADDTYLKQVEDAAQMLVASRKRTFAAIARDLPRILDHGIDDSFGAAADTLYTIAEIVTPLLLDDPEGSLEAIAELAGRNDGYFTATQPEDHEYTPVGWWTTQLPESKRATLAELITDPELAHWIRSTPTPAT